MLSCDVIARMCHWDKRTGEAQSQYFQAKRCKWKQRKRTEQRDSRGLSVARGAGLVTPERSWNGDCMQTDTQRHVCKRVL